jgi:ABC-type multidrug transport system ATPase subunit
MKMIEVQKLSKEFNGKTILNGISFDVKEGEIFGFLIIHQGTSGICGSFR